jgi:adenylate cyclase
MTARNAGVEDGRQMQFRIGINIGDVIHDESRLYGDGVNVAARLEAVAEPGSICITGAVYEQVRNKVSLNVIDLGLQQLKNIAEPVRIYRIATKPFPPPPQPKLSLALPDKPSIAVLPFANLSSDPEQGYLVDGIVEDIITELSRFSELFVIARNSSSRQVGRDLKVAVQDEVARTIVTILAVHVRKAETERRRTNPPNSWQAYDYYLQAIDSLNRFNASFATDKVGELYETRRLLHPSLAIDPNYARSYAVLAYTYGAVWLLRLDSDFLTADALDQVHKFALKSLEIDPGLPEAHASLGLVLLTQRQLDASIAAFERAIDLNHNYVDWIFGVALISVGKPWRAIDVIKAYMRLDPLHAPLASVILGLAHYMLKEYAQALAALRACVSQAPNYRVGHVGRLGRDLRTDGYVERGAGRG